MIERLRQWARSLKREVTLLWLAARDPRTPLVPKLLAACVAAYALSPIDLIPDFIPVLGLLDDLLLVPAGIWLALRLMPTELLDELRKAAQNEPWLGPARKAAFVMVAVWIGLAIGVALVLLR
jgi:uncharacterized membrane protein YkvA (DUF1232 family)